MADDLSRAIVTAAHKLHEEDTERCCFLCILIVSQFTQSHCLTNFLGLTQTIYNNRTKTYIHRTYNNGKWTTCDGGTTCQASHPKHLKTTFKVINEKGSISNEYSKLGEALNSARERGFTSRDEDVEKLLHYLFGGTEVNVGLVMTRMLDEGNSKASSKVNGDLTVAIASTARLMKPNPHHKVFAAVTVSSGSGAPTFRVVQGNGFSRTYDNMWDAEFKLKEDGFWNREVSVEALLSKLTLNGEQKIVHVFSKMATETSGD